VKRHPKFVKWEMEASNGSMKNPEMDLPSGKLT
jgi:hypothetical protein